MNSSFFLVLLLVLLATGEHAGDEGTGCTGVAGAGTGDGIISDIHDISERGNVHGGLPWIGK